MSCLRWILPAALLVAAVPASAAAQRQHTVREGQSLARIAHRYHVRVGDLAAANDLRPNQLLRPGEVLTIPADGVTYVQSGQTLSEIAHDHDCTVDELMRLNHLRPGRGLRVGQRLVLPGYQPAEEQASASQDWGTPEEPNVVHIRRHDESTAVRLLDEQGRVTREALESLAQLMRRHDEDAPELPHPRLALLLAAISNHFGGREITLVSGRRDAVRFTRETSRHVSGQASDIRVEGVPRRVLWDYCRSLASTGCGYYPRSTFVHVDVREHAAQWVDWSRPGRRPTYGNLRGPWRRACRRARGAPSRACSREGRQVTRPDEVPLSVELTEEARALMPEVPSLTPGDEPEDGDDPGES